MESALTGRVLWCRPVAAGERTRPGACGAGGPAGAWRCDRDIGSNGASGRGRQCALQHGEWRPGAGSGDRVMVAVPPSRAADGAAALSRRQCPGTVALVAARPPGFMGMTEASRIAAIVQKLPPFVTGGPGPSPDAEAPVWPMAGGRRSGLAATFRPASRPRREARRSKARPGP